MTGFDVFIYVHLIPAAGFLTYACWRLHKDRNDPSP